MLRLPSRLPGWRRALSRVALAYLLLAQLVLGAVATAQHAGFVLAADGGVLCAGGGADRPDGPASHDGLCCLLGCSTASPQPLLDGAAAAFPAPSGAIAAAGFILAAANVASGSGCRAFHATGPPARA